MDALNPSAPMGSSSSPSAATLPFSAFASPPTPQEWVLRTTAGVELRIRLLDGECATVGRDLTSDLCLKDAGVSRFHATVRVEDGHLWLEDHHSQNGTYVNAERVLRQQLQDGDIVVFGRLPVTVHANDSPTTDALARLSQEDLTALARAAHELTSELDRTALLGRLPATAARMVCAREAAILVWDESRERGQALTAWPESFAGEAKEALTPHRARTVARLDRPLIMTEELGARQASLLFTRLFADDRETTILCLRRCPEAPPFDLASADRLQALIWLTERCRERSDDLTVPLVTAGEPASRLRPEAPRTAVASLHDSGQLCARRGSPILREAEAFLQLLEQRELEPAPRGRRGAPGSGGPGKPAALRAQSLYAVRLALQAGALHEACRREGPWPVATPRLDEIVEEVKALEGSRREYSIARGAESSVLASRRTLVLTLRLLAEALSPVGSGAPSRVELSLDPSPASAGRATLKLRALRSEPARGRGGRRKASKSAAVSQQLGARQLATLQLGAQQAPTQQEQAPQLGGTVAVDRGHHEDPREMLLLSAARHLVETLLEGSLTIQRGEDALVGDDGAGACPVATIELPQPAEDLGHTLALP